MAEALEETGALARQAVERYHETGTVLCLDFPEGGQFGVDWRSYRTGKGFLGIKGLTRGMHFAVYGLHPDGVDMRGFFFHVEPGSVVVRRWDAGEEEFVREGADVEAGLTSAVHRLDFDGRLGPYEPSTEWRSLATHIDTSALEAVGLKVGVSITPEPSTGGGPADGAVVHPTFPALRRSAGSAPRRGPAVEVTRYHFDGTQRLDGLLDADLADIHRDRARREACLLGTMQIAYLVFLHLHSFSSLEYWKEIVALLCSCDAALEEEARQPFFATFVRVLRAQLKVLPADLFADDLLRDNFLAQALRGLHELTRDPCSVGPSLRAALGELWALLSDRFEFDPSSPPDDDTAPVVVVAPDSL